MDLSKQLSSRLGKNKTIKNKLILFLMDVPEIPGLLRGQVDECLYVHVQCTYLWIPHIFLGLYQLVSYWEIERNMETDGECGVPLLSRSRGQPLAVAVQGYVCSMQLVCVYVAVGNIYRDSGRGRWLSISNSIHVATQLYGRTYESRASQSPIILY